MSLAKLFLFAFGVTLVIWYVVEGVDREFVKAPTIIVTPHSGE